jgi:hypothetical protein
MKQQRLVILGSGYLARFMLSLTSFYLDVRHTSRDPSNNLTWVTPKQRLHFDLAQRDTWSNIPSGADLLWCFPTAPVDSVRAFAAGLKGSFRKLVVLGSTSAYDVAEPTDYPPPWINESATIDLNKPRVQGEEFLRQECGAIVLRVSGIYGPNRNPLDWIRTGRVRPSRKYVNLVHAEDLAAVCLAALERGQSGEIYNVSDGIPRTWNEIYMIARDRWPLPVISDQLIQESGKRIDTRKLRDKLGESLRHTDLFASLDKLERSHCAFREGSSKRSSDKAADENTPKA